MVAEKGHRLYLGNAQEVDGTSFVVLRLETHESGAVLSSGSSYERETCNLLFYDTGTGTGQWLLPGHTAVIGNFQPVRESGSVQQS